jgi:nicotinate-nucleotide adenylyltransferase
MKTVCLYFGSFNPIHNGHLIIANHILQFEEVNEVWFVVSPQNPFKKEHKLLNFNHRVDLIKTALEGEHKMKVCTVENKLPKPSFTINTLTYLKEKHPKTKFVIAMGSDGFQNLDKWKNANILISEYSFIVYKRPGVDIKNEWGANIKISDGPQLFISSTHIRYLIKNKKSFRYLVPDVVKELIEINGYYHSELENPA